jgi:hypothetical protein
MEIFKYMRERAKEGMDYVHSIDYFLKKMIDPGEDYPADEKPMLKIDDFKQIFQIAKFDVLTAESDYTLDMLLFLRILKNTAYFIIDDESVSNLWNLSNSILNEFVADTKAELSARVTIALEVFSSLSKYLSDPASVTLSSALVLRLLATS